MPGLLAEVDATGQTYGTVSVDSPINGAHERGMTLPRATGELPNYKLLAEPPDHASSRSRGGLKTKTHNAAKVRARVWRLGHVPSRHGSDPRASPRRGRARTVPDALASRLSMAISFCPPAASECARCLNSRGRCNALA